jgi:hypothetical protein
MMFDVKNRFLNIDFFSFPTRNFVTPIINRGAHTCKIRPTLRDGSLGWRCSRHFVPGYDRCVPPGRACRRLATASS